MFIRNCWYVIAWDSEIADQGYERRMLVGEPILLFRKGSGELIALADRCSHRFAPLSKGRREGDEIRCMYHGLKFNCEGECVEAPGHGKVPARLGLRRYPLTVRQGAIWIWPGNPDRADASLIPVGHGPGGALFNMKSSFMDYDVDYQLINDNLCDFSHIAYVHEHTFAMGQKDYALSLPNIQTKERGVRFERWIADTKDPFGISVAPVDLWQTYDYLVPGILLMLSVLFPAGAAARFGDSGPKNGDIEAALHADFNFQAVTPMSERKSRYFFATGPRYSASPVIGEMMFKVTQAAFIEDKVMITAQQENIDLSAGLHFNAIPHDRAVGHFRSRIQKLLKEEAET